MRSAVLFALVVVLAAAAAGAGERSEKELRECRDALMAKAWVKASPWMTDYEKALAAAKKTGKPIFAYLTRSYAP